MAKKSSIEKSDRRRRMTKQWGNRRKKLKAIAHDKKLPMEERFAATVKPNCRAIRRPRASATAVRCPAVRAAITASTKSAASRYANSAPRA